MIKEGKVVSWNETNIDEILKWKDPLSFNRTILHYVALFGKHAKADVKFLKPFLNYSEVSAKDLSGETCLHNAVNKNNINFLRGIFEEFKEVNLLYLPDYLNILIKDRITLVLPL